MGEENLNLGELKMVNLETGKEEAVIPIKKIEFSEKEGKFENDLDEWFLARDEDYTFEMHIDTELFNKCVKIIKKIVKNKNINDVIKYARKKIGTLPLTKKRTKKILMSRGYSRNEANALLEDIEHRTMSHLDKFFPKNN